MPDSDKTTVGDYLAALKLLPIATRAIFLMHRKDGLSYRKIARRLSLAPLVVEAYIAEAMFMLIQILNHGPTQRLDSKLILDVERILLKQHQNIFETLVEDDSQ